MARNANNPNASFHTSCKSNSSVKHKYLSKMLHSKIYVSDIKTQQELQTYAKQLIKVQTSQANFIETKTNILGLHAGDIFIVNDTDYLILKISHLYKDTSNVVKANHQVSTCQNSIICTLAKDYFPAQLIYPVIIGHVLATVVGEKQDNINVDSFGRITIKFLWNTSLHNSNTNSPNNYLRSRIPVMQYGNCQKIQFIPRIGEEVLVVFIDGNPNCPVVIGSNYNQQHHAPYPNNKSPYIHGIKLQIQNTKHTDNAYHELQFNNTKGKEVLLLHSHKNLNLQIKHDYISHIQGNAVYETKNFSIKILDSNIEWHAKKITLGVKGNQIVIDADKISVLLNPHSSIKLLSKQVSKTAAVARVTDIHTCPKQHSDGSPHQGGAIQTGANNITNNHLAIATIGSTAQCVNATDKINSGVAGITLNKIPIAVKDCTTEHEGKITAGSDNLFVEKLVPALTLPFLQNKPTSHIPEIVELLYVTGSKTFYALTNNEAVEFHQAADEMQKIIMPLVEANNTDDKDRAQKIIQAKSTLTNDLMQLIYGSNSSDITEVISFAGKKWTYVKSDKIKSHWRAYKINKDIAQRALITTKGKLDYKKLKHQIRNNIKGDILWQTSFQEAMSKWAKTIDTNGSLEKVFFDYKHEFKADTYAQVMRFLAESSSAIGFKPSLKKFSFTCDARAALSLAEAKVEINDFFPSEEGLSLNFTSSNKQHKTINLDFGKLRVELSLELFGFIGCSVMACINLEFGFSLNPSLSKSLSNPSKRKKLFLFGALHISGKWYYFRDTLFQF
ncbi:MAG: hypothetical protein COC15_00700 [Legionellales bacterium]|nr:MAG: hypothetical protein COC15_00700 [Legionellales bacterium]